MFRKLTLTALVTLIFIAPLWAQRTSDVPAKHSSYLRQASDGIKTLQSWYTQSTGLYQTTGWWNSANAITVLANYSRVSRSKAYLPVFTNTFEQAQRTSSGFLNNYYDDEGWWALAWIDAYDLTRQQSYLAMATSIFTDMTGGWDSTCNGGIWWSKDRKYKNAIANELFLSVAAHLAARTSDPADRARYLAWAEKEWSWFANSGMINARHLINDGLDLTTCKNNQQNTWTYNQGVILGGLTELNKVAPNPTLPATAQSIAAATLTRLTDANGILHDTCEPNCGADGVQFKGIFLRNLMALNSAFPNPRYKKFTDTNAESIWNNSQGPNYEFGQVWSGPFNAGNAGSQSSALDAFVAAAQMNSRN
ncbi:MAG TPA: glycoside hydrolase family 76 protein [Alloacidobacterium sp.]|nr:glycoside hydrolase family 76 protein [Alloacidobacterium sp.]